MVNSNKWILCGQRGTFWNERKAHALAQLRSIESSESRNGEVGQFFFFSCHYILYIFEWNRYKWFFETQQNRVGVISFYSSNRVVKKNRTKRTTRKWELIFWTVRLIGLRGNSGGKWIVWRSRWYRGGSNCRCWKFCNMVKHGKSWTRRHGVQFRRRAKSSHCCKLWILKLRINVDDAQGDIWAGIKIEYCIFATNITVPSMILQLFYRNSWKLCSNWRIKMSKFPTRWLWRKFWCHRRRNIIIFTVLGNLRVRAVKQICVRGWWRKSFD